MSKMKHLLRKLHIGGGGVTGHQGLVDARRVDSAPTVPPSSSSSIESDLAVADAGTSTSGGGGAADFNFLEEEFQVQLALAISASDPDGDGSAQIDVAKRISLGCSSTAPAPAPAADPASFVDSLSLRYWSYNVVNYNEKVIDGFYDVHCVSSSSLVQGKMPSLVELKGLDNFDYEVVVVNRLLDSRLRELEKRVYIMSLESRFSGGLGFSGLVQKIADVVVQRMGGPVGDADEMSRRWKTRNSELRTSLNSIILPLGCLDVGLSRHRALLFKVLADRVNLPCMLIKGSYYTGTDDGAVDLIKIDDGSELIIDLMGAPGSLIPVEVPSSDILNAGFGVRGFPGLTEATECASFLPGDRPQTPAFPTNLGSFPEIDILKSEEALFPAVVTNEVTNDEMLQCHPDKLVSCLGEDLISLMGDVSSGTIASGHKEENSNRFPIEQQTGVEISLLSATASVGLVLHNCAENKLKVVGTGFDANFFSPPGMVEKSGHENQIHESSLPSEMDSHELPFEQTTNSDDKKCHRNEMEINLDAEVDKQSGMKLIETERSNLVLGEGADWEILWEHLQIGERIGIGSYGEVYHAELNGTEVAVKKFLDQDFSGDALMQFKCEIEIMLRLRHPNVVLFMGAVTTPPNLSILTEFLPRGSLYRLLHRPNCPIDEKRRLRMAIDVAKGMNYLHTSHPTIVHRDLKSPNLLVDKNWVVKVCDFGLSRLKHHTFLSSKSTAGTPEWMAPEVLRNEPASEKCDIYSFGVILWELATCQIPWKDLNPMQVVGAVGFQNRRLEIPNHIDPSAARIIQDCWQMEPHLRPSFSQLISRLRRVQRLHIQKNTL